ncbi:MAG: hypothetical protein KGI88_07925 [Betaproteobacteria bacterium]|nr:hypothetical protein [Betaproteobacteria bacterium]
MSEINFSGIVTAVKNAVSGSEKVEHAWKSAGEMVAQFYGTREAFEEVKTQFIADAIITAFSADERALVKLDLPRAKKGVPDMHETTRKARKAVIDKAGKYFGRIATYAFGKVEKSEGETEGETESAGEVTQVTKWQKALTTMLGQVEKAEGVEGVDLIKFHAQLKQALSILG